MDSEKTINQLRQLPNYHDQIVYTHIEQARDAIYGDFINSSIDVSLLLSKLQIPKLYQHQAQALHEIAAGKNVILSTGPASGKSLCYQIAILDSLEKNSESTCLLLFPTKALCQDQALSFKRMLGFVEKYYLCGVYDGDTGSSLRKKLREYGKIVFTNPDMLHASIMPQHGKWAQFFRNLKFIVLDEVHIYTGLFGSNMAQLFRRLNRLLVHYSSSPQIIASSATIQNPQELIENLTLRDFSHIAEDTSPKGKKTYLFWNPPRIRAQEFRSRRSANVEAHELMSHMIKEKIPSIVFSKAKMTAEMIHRYVEENLHSSAPHLASKITPYRGGYLPSERKAIEAKLFTGEYLGVSTTNALELGIDIGNLDVCIIVGYPGTLASFFQQAGRAGRRSQDSLSILVGVDTAINQYIMSTPHYIFSRPIEKALVDPNNPFVVLDHLRCALFELPLQISSVEYFGPFASMLLEILQVNLKCKLINSTWYHSASEIPHHEVSLRNYAGDNVLIRDIETEQVIGEVSKYDAEPLVHPQAIYMHRGDTYEVQELDMVRNFAKVKKVEVDYYTQPLGGTDVHHIDHTLREKPFGSGMAYWGEVTSYFKTHAYEKIPFYSLDADSVHGVDLPFLVLETIAVWIVPSEQELVKVREQGLNVTSGLRGIGYASRMLLPLYLTCDTLSFSHSIGAVNAPWCAIFIYERYPHGLGFTERMYDMLHEILPSVYEAIKKCSCTDGCPCCVGKPLRGALAWNIERGEGNIPCKHASLMILESLLGDRSNLQCEDSNRLQYTATSRQELLKVNLRRRLERKGEPIIFHGIDPFVQTKIPDAEPVKELVKADVTRRIEKKNKFQKDLQKRISQKMSDPTIDAFSRKLNAPKSMRNGLNSLKPTHFPGKPEIQENLNLQYSAESELKPISDQQHQKSILIGDPLASKARLRKKSKSQ